MNLALFDFDGTITTCDTFTLFLRYSISPKVQMMGVIQLSPYILAYKLGWIKENVMRTQLCRVGYAQRNIDELEKLGHDFALNRLPKYIRKNALERILWHKQQGDKVVIVSASLSVYLRVWCQLYDLDLICNQFEIEHGKCTGHLVDGDCGYVEKVIRIRKHYNLNDFQRIFAYGDSANDEAMLAIADRKFYRWEEV